jgi:Tol biopolymer transport system component
VNQTPAVSPDGATIAYASVRNKNYDIWLMSRDGTNQRAFTKAAQQNETEPRFLRDGSLAYIVERREANRTVRMVVKADLATGTITPLTGTDLPSRPSPCRAAATSSRSWLDSQQPPQSALSRHRRRGCPRRPHPGRAIGR